MRKTLLLVTMGLLLQPLSGCGRLVLGYEYNTKTAGAIKAPSTAKRGQPVDATVMVDMPQNWVLDSVAAKVDDVNLTVAFDCKIKKERALALPTFTNVYYPTVVNSGRQHTSFTANATGVYRILQTETDVPPPTITITE